MKLSQLLNNHVVEYDILQNPREVIFTVGDGSTSYRHCGWEWCYESYTIPVEAYLKDENFMDELAELESAEDIYDLIVEYTPQIDMWDYLGDEVSGGINFGEDAFEEGSIFIDNPTPVASDCISKHNDAPYVYYLWDKHYKSYGIYIYTHCEEIQQGEDEDGEVIISDKEFNEEDAYLNDSSLGKIYMGNDGVTEVTQQLLDIITEKYKEVHSHA